MQIINANFHAHCNRDPLDNIPYSLDDLIRTSKNHSITALAVTCHEAQVIKPYDIEKANKDGIILMTGMEANVEGIHILIINFQKYPNGQCTFDELLTYKYMSCNENGLIIAPHAFYPTSYSIGPILNQIEKNQENKKIYPVVKQYSIFDAIEWSGIYTKWYNYPNKKAIEFAQKNQIPIVGNSDTHQLLQLRRTYSQVAIKNFTADSVCTSIKNGYCSIVTEPLTTREVIHIIKGV